MRFVSANLAILLLMLLVSSAVAVPAASGPDALKLVQTPDGLLLSWQPPADWNPAEYRVFVNGRVFAVTEETNLLVGTAQTYAVQAVDEARESLPSLLLGTHNAGPLDCGYVSSNTNMSKAPFLFVRIHEDCAYWIIELLNREPPVGLPITVNIQIPRGQDA